MILIGATILLLAFVGLAPAQEPVDPVTRGRALIKASRPQDAERVLRQLLAADPGRADARTLIGFLLLERGRPSEAEEEFRAVLAGEPGNPSARFGLGVALSRKGAVSAAASEFERIIYSPNVGTGARVQWILSKFIAGRDDEAYVAALDAVLARPSEAAFHRLLGFFLQLRHRPAEAILSYHQSLEFDPDNLEAHSALVSLYRSRSDLRSALQWCDRALELSPANAFLLQDKAGLLEALGRTDEARAARQLADSIVEADSMQVDAGRAHRAGESAKAESLLRRATGLNPVSWSAWCELGDLMRAAGRPTEAADAFARAIETGPQESRGWVGLASVQESESDTAAATGTLRRAIARGARGAELHAALATLYLKLGSPVEARREAEEALTELPGDPALLSLSGDAKDLGGRSLEAIGDYDSALASDPRQTGALIGKGYALLRTGQPSAAAKAFQQAVEIDPARGDAWNGVIDALRRSGSRLAAERACRSCLAEAHADAGCRGRLAALLFETDRFREAASEYARLFSSGDTSKGVLEGLASSRLRMGDHAAAIKLFEESLARYGEDLQVRLNLGFLHRCVGDLPSATGNYRRALELSPRDREIAIELGTVLYLGRNYLEAVEPLETALRLRPGWGKAHYSLALVYWSLGQRVLALAHARQAESRGVRDAARVVRVLTEQLSLSQPRLMTYYRRRP
jgi:tetratricopeptide (TPR) repeat protein